MFKFHLYSIQQLLSTKGALYVGVESSYVHVVKKVKIIDILFFEGRYHYRTKIYSLSA